MPVPAFDYHKDARAVRHHFARKAEPLIKKLQEIVSDPDLQPEAKVRRAAPVRKEISALGDACRKTIREHAAKAKQRLADHAPARLRRAAATAEPDKAAQYAQLFSFIGDLNELTAFADEIERAYDKPSKPAAWALAARLQAVRNDENAEAVNAQLARVDGWLGADLAEIRADALVTEHLQGLFEWDVERALGEKMDPAALLARANGAAQSDAEVQAAFKLLGADATSPLSLTVTDRVVQTLSDLGAIDRLFQQKALDDAAGDVEELDTDMKSRVAAAAEKVAA